MSAKNPKEPKVNRELKYIERLMLEQWQSEPYVTAGCDGTMRAMRVYTAKKHETSVEKAE